MNMIKSITRTMIAALVIPIIVMMLTLTIYEYNSTMGIYRSSMSMLTQRVNNIASNYFEMINSNINSGIKNPAYQRFLANMSDPDAKAAAENEFVRTAQYSNFIEKTVMTNAAGRLIAGDVQNVSEMIDKNKFETAKKNAMPVLDTTFHELDGKNVFTIYIPMSSSGRVVDVILVEWINAGFVEGLIHSDMNTSAERVFIIDSDSNIIGCGEDGKIKQLSEFNGPDGLLQNIKNVLSWKTDTMHNISYVNENGVRVNAVFWRNSDYDMTIVCESSRKVMLSNVMVAFIIILIFFFVLVVVSIISYINIQRRIKKPFEEVMTTMSEYENGNFEYRPVISGDDEISNITASLWNMAMKLSDIYDDIRENEHCYKKSMEFASDMLTDYTISKNKYVTDGEKWLNMFGFEFVNNEKQMNTEIMSRIHDEDKKTFKAYRDKIFSDVYDNQEKQMQLEFRMKLKDDQYHWILRRDILVKGKTDDIEHILGSYAIIDDRKKNELELSSKAHYDQLTKLYNRATFMAKAKEWMRANEKGECSMIFVDADNFKFVNDTYGHEAGDDVIRYIADTIKQAVGDKGLCGRYGGDEFIMFIYDKNDSVEVAKCVKENLPKDFAVPSQKDVVLSMHSSIGIAHYPEHAYDVENLLKRADEAMYVSKKSGKDRYTVFDNSIKLV